MHLDLFYFSNFLKFPVRFVIFYIPCPVMSFCFCNFVSSFLVCFSTFLAFLLAVLLLKAYCCFFLASCLLFLVSFQYVLLLISSFCGIFLKILFLFSFKYVLSILAYSMTANSKPVASSTLTLLFYSTQPKRHRLPRTSPHARLFRQSNR